MPREYDFYTHEATTYIDAPPEQVWEIVSDLTKSAELAGSGQVLAVRPMSGGPTAIGATYEADEKIGAKFKSVSKITEFEPPSRITWLSAPTPLKGAPDERWHMWTFTLAPEKGGTRLTQEVRAARAPFPMRIVQLIGVATSGGTKTIATGMDKTLQNIKERAEGAGVTAT